MIIGTGQAGFFLSVNALYSLSKAAKYRHRHFTSFYASLEFTSTPHEMELAYYMVFSWLYSTIDGEELYDSYSNASEKPAYFLPSCGDFPATGIACHASAKLAFNVS